MSLRHALPLVVSVVIALTAPGSIAISAQGMVSGTQKTRVDAQAHVDDAPSVEEDAPGATGLTANDVPLPSATASAAVALEPTPLPPADALVPKELVAAASAQPLDSPEVTPYPTPEPERVHAPAETPGAPAWRTLTPGYTARSPLPMSGQAMYYNPGVMARVIANRIKYRQIEPCGGCIGYVAMLRYGDLDRRVWLQLDQGRIEGPFHVVDVASTQHVGLLLSRGWAVDIDHKTAQRWGMRMPRVTIWEDPPLALLLASFSTPLHWSATIAPTVAFVSPPHSSTADDHPR